MLLSTATDPFSTIIMVLVGLVFALVGFGFIYLWYRDVRKARASRSWPVTTGRVLTSKVESQKGRMKGSTTTLTVYNPLVVYEYTVNEVRYQSQQIGVGDSFKAGEREDAKHKIAPYPVGASVQVFYDPTHPQQAVLEHNVNSGVGLVVLGGLILVIVALLLLPWNRWV